MFLLNEMNQNKIKPELEIYDLGMMEFSLKLIKQKKILPQPHFQFVVGTQSGLSASPLTLGQLVSMVPEDGTWAAAGIGKNQIPVNLFCLAMGGHVRLGFEDNIYYNKGTLAESNQQFVERIVRIAGEINRPIATVKETREILYL